jgi:DNA-directed RNA polymerase I, II, and III subunit RPABC1
MSNPDDIIQMHNRVLTNFNQMLKDRGYITENLVTFDDEYQVINNEILIVMIINEYLDPKKKTAIIKELDKRKLTYCIIVCGGKADKIDTMIQYETIDPKRTIEVFEKTSLLINITNHVLVPKHRILSEDERQELFERYHIQDNSQIPKLLITDPISRYYGLKKGQVVEITRNEDINKHISYRVVV